MLKKLLCCLMVIVMSLITLGIGCPAVSYAQDVIIEDFDTVSQWQFPADNRDYIALCTEPQYVKSGSSSAKLIFKAGEPYEYEFANENWSAGGLNVEQDGKMADTLSFWIYGCDNENLSVRFNYSDKNGNKGLKTKRVYLGYSGWKYVTLDISNASRIYSIVLKNQAVAEETSIYIDALTVGYKETPDLPASTPATPQIMQEGNTNPLTDLEITGGGDAGSGVTYLNSREVLNYDESNQWKMYSPHLAIDGDDSTIYSSGLYYKENPSNDWIDVILPKATAINKVSLMPGFYGSNFPYDFDIKTSIDGSLWQTVKSVENANPRGQEELSYNFNTTTAKYIRILSKRLKPQSKGEYYAQFAEIRVYDTVGDNVALYSKGAEVRASNMLNGDLFDYDTFFEDTALTGVQWVNITNESAYSAYKSEGSSGPSATEIRNFKRFSDHGIHVLYRFTNAPSREEVAEDRDAAADRFFEAMRPFVEQLKDYVDVWGIFGEINFRGNASAEDHAYVIAKVAGKIREIDPDAKINTATALVDYEWTDLILKNGLKDVVDIIGIHIYKEQGSLYNMPEMSGNFIKDGVDTDALELKYLDYTEEIEAYRNLVAGYSPDIQIMVTEVSEPLTRSEKNDIIEAKFLTRQYCMDKRLGLDGTFWFTVDPISAPHIVSTLVGTEGKRLPAWYSLQNYNTVFSGDVVRSSKSVAVEGNTSTLMYDVYENENEYIIPYWYAMPFRNDFNGSLIDIDLSVLSPKEVTAVDLLTGKEQVINLTNDKAENLIARDYVTVLRVTKDRMAEGVMWNNCDTNPNVIWTDTDIITITNESNPGYVKEGSGSIKVTRSADGGAYIRNSKEIPKLSRKAVKTLELWVYGENAENSTLCLYGIGDNGQALNCDNITDAQQVIQNGWQKLRFDITGLKSVDILIWKNAAAGSALYFDDMRLIYQAMDEPMETFDNYSDNWLGVTPAYFTLSNNTDRQYIKSGSGSLRVDCTEGSGEAYFLRSKYWQVPNVNGKQIPMFDGYDPKGFGFWVYNADAEVVFVNGSVKKTISEPGWHYLDWELPESGVSYENTTKKITQLIMKCTKSGTIYIDDLDVRYVRNRAMLLNGTEQLEIDKMKNGDIISYDVNPLADVEGASILIAAYDENDTMIMAERNTVSADVKSVSMTVGSSNTIQKVKGFLWNSITQAPILSAECAER